MSASVIFEKPCDFAAEGVKISFTQYEGNLSATVTSFGQVTVNGVPMGGFHVTFDILPTDLKLYNFRSPMVDYTHAKGKLKYASHAACVKIREFAKQAVISIWNAESETIKKDLAENNLKAKHEALIDAHDRAYIEYIKAKEDLATFNAQNLVK